MRKCHFGGAVIAAFIFPTVGTAAAPASVDGYYVADSTLDIEDAVDDDGDGFGLRITANTKFGLRLHGEYQSVTLDDSDLDLHQFRLGAGWLTQGTVRFGGVAEYIDVSLESDDIGGADLNPDGFGIHARGEASLGKQFELYGQAGYVSLSDSGADVDGPEYLIGVVFNATPALGIGVDYRYSDFEVDDEGKADVTLEDLRVGVHFNFGT